jgi:hypothetical protein
MGNAPEVNRRLTDGKLVMSPAWCDDLERGICRRIAGWFRWHRPSWRGGYRFPAPARRAARGLGPGDRAVRAAGSRKTVLLRSWISKAGAASCAAWVPAGRAEHDPQQFWLSVLAALRQTGPRVALRRER